MCHKPRQGNHEPRNTTSGALNHFLRRFSIYGDFWLRYLHWGARHNPWFLEPMFIFAFTVMFWFVLGKARRSVARNLGVLIPGSSPWMNQIRVLRVFWNFAWTLADVAHVRHGRDCIRWEVCGSEHLDELEQGTAGAILLTAHMGNYDVAAPLFAQKIHRPIHLVRTPERERQSQEFEKDQRDQMVSGNFVIHYNEPGNMLGVTLARALGDGGIVAIQGDRILFDVSPMPVPFKEGVDWNLPRGPFLLSLVARAAIHPVFIIRMGWRRYRVQAEPVIETPAPSRDRERLQQEAAQKWSAVLRRVVEQHWRQWFVFEEVFARTQSAVAAGAEPAAGTAAQALTASATQPDVVAPAPSSSSSMPVDSVIPAKSNRSLGITFFWSAFAGGLSSAIMLRRLLEWTVGDWWHVVGAILAWPLLWFFTMVMIVQISLWITMLVMAITRLPARACDGLACGLTLVTFSAIAWSEVRGGCSVGWWLGVITFAGIFVGLATEGVMQMRSGEGSSAI